MTKPPSPKAVLRPAAGRRVRHRDGAVFEEGGERVVLDSYYRRLLAAGDLERAEQRNPKPGKSTSRPTSNTDGPGQQGKPASSTEGVVRQEKGKSA